MKLTTRDATAVLAGGGLFTVGYLLYHYLKELRKEDTSTTSSAQSTRVYETRKAVSEYLMFHFGASEDILPYPFSVVPHSALDFASRTAAICKTWVLRKGLALELAFDVGCAVGRTSFDLSSDFPRVVGVDFSHAFIAAANDMKAKGSASYTHDVEGEIKATRVATIPPGSRPSNTTFIQGDACNLPTAKELGGAFTVIHAANLLCRLPDPMCVIFVCQTAL